MVHVKSFYAGDRYVDTKIAAWLNALPQPVTVEVHATVAPWIVLIAKNELAVQGTTGLQGPIGLQGVQGPIGPTGLMGAQGPIGLTGAQGPIGPTGVQGPGFAQAHAEKTLAQSIISSVLLVPVTDLAFAVLAGQRWVFKFYVVFDAHATGDIKFSVAGPGTGTWSIHTQQVAGGGYNSSDALALGASMLAAGAGVGVKQVVVIEGSMLANAPGVVQLHMAQNTSNANPSTVHPQSFVVATKVN